MKSRFQVWLRGRVRILRIETDYECRSSQPGSEFSAWGGEGGIEGGEAGEGAGWGGAALISWLNAGGSCGTPASTAVHLLATLLHFFIILLLVVGDVKQDQGNIIIQKTRDRIITLGCIQQQQQAELRQKQQTIKFSSSIIRPAAEQTWNLSKILHTQIFRLKVLHRKSA